MQKLAETCIKRPVFATMLIMALVVLGLDAYRKLGIDFFPKVEFPFAQVTTVLRGAAPEEVESQVTKPIEEAVNTIAGIEELRSTSSEGVSLVAIQFSLDKDPDVAVQEVRDKINTILSQLPDDAEPPAVQKVATDASPVLSVVVSSPRDPRETTKLADDVIKKNIESLNGVGQVSFVGDRKRQVQVWLDGNKLYAYNLNVEQIRQALAAQNVEVPGGTVDQGSRQLSLRTLGRLMNPREFERIIVGTQNGAPIRVSDIGRVLDGFEEPRSMARQDGLPAVVLDVRKQAGTNSLQVIGDVKARIAELKKLLPGDFKVSYARDQSEFIQEAFNAVTSHLVEGSLFAALIVLLFLGNWRSTLIAAIAIPTSVISTYTLMNYMGFSLNQITMLALTLMVGIVIDDAIVVLENIYRKMEHDRMEPVAAAIQGTKEIGLAVLATTLSLAVVFLPVALMSGIVGRFMSSFGYTAAFAVMVSLLVSFTLTPMMCSRFLRFEDHGKSGFFGRIFGFFDWINAVLAGWYRGLLAWSMRRRWVIVVICWLVMASSVPLFTAIGKDFLPLDDQSEFEILVRMPPGSSLAGSSAVMAQLEEEIRQLPGVKSQLTTLGADIQKQVDRGSIIVNLVPIKARKYSQDQLMVMARDKLKAHRDLVISVQRPALVQGGGPNKPLLFTLQGPDLLKLDGYAQVLKKKLESTRGVEDVESSYEGGKPELRVRIHRDKAADLGVNVGSIATALRTLVGGDDQVTTYREGDDRYDVQLRVEKEFRNSADVLNRLYVPSATLGNVPVSNVAHFEEALGPTQIERFNRQRQILLSANINAAQGQSLSEVIKILDSEVAKLNMPPGYSTALLGQTREFGKAGVSFAIAFLLSIVFMYMILAAQFESFLDPVIILMSLPLSVPFAVLSLYLAGENYSLIYSSVGILVLFGIVKKNSILQIDHIKALRREGMERLPAIMKGCEDRLRPILMTTAALVAGMIPLALGGGAGSGSRRSVAIIVIGGQTLCLLLTLLVTPVAYSIFDDFALWFRRWTGTVFTRMRRVPALPLFALVMMMGLAATATLQADTPPKPRVGVGAAQRKLTLQESIELALRNNLEIEVERVNRDLSRQALRAAEGVFDPILRYSPGREERVTPTPNVLAAPNGALKEAFWNNNFSAGQKLNWQGASVRLDFTNARTSTNNPFTGLNPYFNSQLVLSYIQPLWRGRVTDNERTTIRLRRKQIDATEVDFEVRVIDVVTRVQQAYWDLVAVREDVDVRSEAVELGRTQVGLSKRQIDAGTLAPVELSAAEAELERRLDSLYASLELVTQAENNLKSLLAPNREDGLWGEEIVPTERATVAPPEWADLKSVVDGAVRKRPELRGIAVRQESNAIQKALSEDLLKPGINLTASYINSGLAGSINRAPNPFQGLFPGGGGGGFPQLPGQLVGGFGQTLQNVFGGDFQTYQVGIAIDWNPRNRGAKAGVQQAVLQGRQLELERARTAQLIEAQVRNGLQAIETARQRIAAAEASARAAQIKLESETRLFQTGESTNFLVLTRQNDYADSRRRAVVAKLDLNKAIARVEQALGSTLEEHKITLK